MYGLPITLILPHWIIFLQVTLMTQAQPAALPSMPGTVIKLLQMFADPDVCLSSIVDTIKTDPALAGRILKAANSSAVGASQEVSDLRRAATLLGKKTVSTLALSFSLADKSIANGEHAELFESFWNQSIVTGVAASVLSERYGSVQCDEAFLVGLLCRIGRLGAITFAPDQFTALAELSRKSGTNLDSKLLLDLGMCCEELTLQYMRAWKLPRSFVQLVSEMQEASQRDCSRAQNTAPTAPSDGLDASTTLRVAAAIGEFIAGNNTGIALATIHELMDLVLADSDESVDALIDDVMAEFSTYAEMLDVAQDTFPTAAELHAQAMTHLTEVMLAPDNESDLSEDATSEVDWLKHRVSHLTEQLTLDTMTSLHNRAYFDMQLEKRIAIARLSHRQLAVLFLDINEFKQVNDVHGHDVGDAVICSVAASLKTITRKDDVVARYGGDEFVILCEVSEITGFDAQAERITAGTTNLVAKCRDLVIDVSLAIGGAIGVPDDRADFGERLLRESDEAMYAAKQSRCNPVTRKIGQNIARALAVTES